LPTAVTRAARLPGGAAACRGAVAAALACLLCGPAAAVAAADPAPPASPAPDRGFSAAYELTEMGMNGFRNFAGELGYRFGARHRVRLSVMEVDVSERDLAGWWSAAVDGKGVEGYLRGYEVHGDRFFKGGWYVSLNAGYYANTFEHVTLPERLSNETLTAGLGIGYSRSRLFGVEHLSINFTNPIRYYFHPIEETPLGSATVRTHKIVPNTWLFVGYAF